MMTWGRRLAAIALAGAALVVVPGARDGGPAAGWRPGLLSIATPAMAQPADPAPRPRGPRGQAKREKVKERIRAMRAWVLTEQLDLDVATAEKMFPVLARYDDELARLLAERKQLRAQLATAQRAGNDGPILDGLLDRLVANQRARWTAEDQRFAELRTLLTPEQAAALLDLLPEVDRKILRELRQAVDRGATGGRDDDLMDVRGPRARGRGKQNPFGDRK